MSRAFVLGGGVAGLHAAFLLRDQGFAVTLLESRGWLGGRAFSSHDRVLGRALDNGPHVMLGCYRAMRALLRRLGTEGDFLVPPGLRIAYRLPGGGRAALALRPWRVPLAMPAALFGLPLGWGGRLRALRGLVAALRRAPADQTLADWLRRHGQHGTPAAFFWLPLCRAVMNAEPEAVAAELFLATMREAFSGAADQAAIWIPARPWGELIDASARRELARAGVELATGARVAALHRDGAAVRALELADGTRRELADDDLVVSALPWRELAGLLGDGELPAARLQASPIVTACFEVEDAIAVPDEGPLVILVDGAPFHFLCRTPGDPPGRFALLSGGGIGLEGMGVEAVAAAARRQLARHYPGFFVDAPAIVRIRKEARATFVGSPGDLALRPAPGPLPGGPANLMACGDWTGCGLPSTLEGAARSAEALAAVAARWRVGAAARP